MSYLNNDGLLYFWQKLKTLLAGKVDKVDGKGLSTNDYTTAEKNKLSGIATGANKTVVDSELSSTSTNPVQNKVINTALSNKVDSVSGKGLSTNDYTTAEKNKLAGLSNYSLPTASASQLGGIKVGTNLNISDGVLSAVDTTYSDATTSASGLMSSADKTKLNGIATGANNYSLPTASSTVLGGVKVGTNLSINSSGVLSATNTTYNVATSSANGLMSSTDKSKLDAFGAASTYALKSDITGMYKYKGSVATVSALPSTGNTTGDVYNVEAGGMNYAWDGSKWDALGEIFTITAITNAEIDTIVAS